jgi:hypothetical protein
LTAGAGKSEIIFPESFFPAEGFKTQLTPLYARTALFCGKIDIAVVSVEMTSLPQAEVDLLKKIASKETDVTEDRCYICVTHTFSSPHILPNLKEKNEELTQALRTAVGNSARDAKANLKAARLKLGRDECLANCNRDIKTEDGWWVSDCGSGPSNKTATVVSAEALDGSLLFALVHYAVQSSVLDGSLMPDGCKAVSSDLAGMACAEIEETTPGAIAIFLMGAAGDQAPARKAKSLRKSDSGFIETDIGDMGIEMCRDLGHMIAESANNAIKKGVIIDCEEIGTDTAEFLVPAQKMPNMHSLKPTLHWDYVPDGKSMVSIEAFRIGPIAFLCVKPELNCVTGDKIIEDSPFGYTLVLTMVNGGAKYMADAESYDRFTYEAMNSPFGKGAAEMLVEYSVCLLRKINK